MGEETTRDLDFGRPWPPALATAIVRAHRAVRAVGKDGRNRDQNYDYATAEAITSEARAALTEADLCVVRTDWRVDYSAGYEGVLYGKQDRKVRCAGRLYVHFELVHSSGASRSYEVSIPVMPSAGRPDDKAELAALTSVSSYFTLGLLQIERRGMDDIDGRGDADDPEPPRGAAPSTPREPGPERDPNLAAKLIEQIGAAKTKAELLPVREAAAHPKTGLRGSEFDRVVAIYNERVKVLNTAAPTQEAP